jgi:hypothetical protein
VTTTTELPTEDEYTDAISKIEAVLGDDAEALVSMIETVRDDEILHETDNESRGCVDGCPGCLAETIADAVTRAVNGKAA